ncbi:MAG: inositol 2-dehydrogenase [Gammaproteobacteria bacterium]|nr:MAG: inositol 2-dehydrogenase [Gammaproteobacteria bacterium]UTW42171.1 inositol 2-dehydrogenase [bacterium SCSIO 12844]
MKLGLIGTGRIGQVHVHHIKQYLKGYTVTHAYDPFGDDKWFQENHIERVDSTEILVKQAIDAVLICSPSTEHIAQIILAAEHKKHIFCEKPIGLDIDQIELALKAVNQHQIKLQVGFNRRFDPTFAQLQNQINDKVKVPQIIRITSRDPAAPPEEYIKKSGGIFLDMAIHDFDMARFLAGSEVVEVYATGSCLVNPVFAQYDDVDTAMIQLKFANGALGVIDNSRQAVYGYDQRIEVFSNHALLQAENQLINYLECYANDVIEKPVLKNFFLERYKDAYINQFKAFFDAIENDQPTKVSGFDGLQAVKIAKAAQKSFELKKPVRV